MEAIELDPMFPEWGSRHVSLRIKGEMRLADLLTHLYVLIPVLDDDKHYWVDEAEVEKLMRRGEGWLAAHPERDLIVRRYLKKQARLYAPALLAMDEAAPPSEDPDAPDREENLEERVSLRDQRLGSVQAVLKASGARRVLDLGCGAGALLARLIKEDYDLVVGVDVSVRSLEEAARRLRLDTMHDAQRQKISLIHSALTYRDKRLKGFDAAALVEVIEHLDPPRLAAFEQSIFGSARPTTIVGTHPTLSTTCAGRLCRPASFAIPTIASNGPARSSLRGLRASRCVTVTEFATCPWAPSMMRSGRRRRWRCSADEDCAPGPQPHCARWRVGFGQEHVRPGAL